MPLLLALASARFWMSLVVSVAMVKLFLPPLMALSVLAITPPLRVVLAVSKEIQLCRLFEDRPKIPICYVFNSCLRNVHGRYRLFHHWPGKI